MHTDRGLGGHFVDPEPKQSIFVETRLARINWYRAPTLDDLVKALLAIQADPHFTRGQGLLVIDHGTDFVLSSIAEARQWIAKTAALLLHFRACAVVITCDCQFRTAEMFCKSAFDAGINVRVFRDELAAGKWLLSA